MPNSNKTIFDVESTKTSTDAVSNQAVINLDTPSSINADVDVPSRDINSDNSTTSDVKPSSSIYTPEELKVRKDIIANMPSSVLEKIPDVANLYNTTDFKVARFNKYFADPVLISGNNRTAFMETVARNQSGGELIGKAALHTVAEIAGGIVEGAGALTNPHAWGHIFGLSEDNFKTTWLQELGSLMNQGVKDAVPIYMTQRAQKGGLALADATWWASMFPTLASSASAFIPAGAVIKGIKMLGKGSKVAKALSQTGKYAKAGSRLETFGLSVLSRQIDSYREAAGTFDEQRHRLMELGFSEKEATSRAGEMASKAQRLGWLNLAFDLVQWNFIKGSGNKLREGVSRSVAKKLGRKSGVSKDVKDAVDKAVIKSTKPGHIAFGLGQTAFSEAADEVMIGFYQSEAVHSTNKKYGMTVEDNLNILDRFAQHMGEGETWDEAFWGALGGLTMGLFAPGYSRLVHGKEMQLNDERIANEIFNKADMLNATIKNITTNIEKGNITQAHLLQTELVANLMTNAHATNSLGIWSEILDNLKKADESQLAEMGYTKEDVTNSKGTSDMLLNAEKIYKSFVGKDFSTKDVKFTNDDNEYIGRLMSNYTFLIDEHKRILKTLESQENAANGEQIAKLKEQLSEASNVDTFLKQISQGTEASIKEASKNIDSNPIAQTLFQLLDKAKRSKQALSFNAMQQIQYLSIKKQLEQTISKFGTRLIDQHQKSIQQEKLNQINKILEGLQQERDGILDDKNAKNNVDGLAKELEDINAAIEELKKSGKLDEKAISKIEGIAETIDNISDKDVANSVALINSKIKQYQKVLDGYADANKLAETLKGMKDAAKEMNSNALMQIKAEMNAAKTIEELDKIMKDPASAGFDIKGHYDLNKRRIEGKDIKKKDKEIRRDDAKDNSLKSNTNAVRKHALTIKDKAVQSEILERINKLDEAYNAGELSREDAIEQLGKISDEISKIVNPTNEETGTKAKQPPAKPKETPTKKFDPNKSKLEDIVPTRELLSEYVNDLIESLDLFTEAEIQKRAQEQYPDVSEEDANKFYEVFDQIQKNALDLKQSLLQINDLLSNEDIKTYMPEELERIGQTIAQINYLFDILQPHVRYLSNTDFGKLSTANHDVMELLRNSVLLMSEQYRSVVGIENFDVGITEEQHKALTSLQNSLSNFVYISIPNSKDAKSINITGDNNIDNLLNSIVKYLESYNVKGAKNITFEQMAQHIFDSTRGLTGFQDMMSMIKEVYNYLHTNGINTELLNTENLVEVDIEDISFYHNTAQLVIGEDMKFKAPHREGVSFSFEQGLVDENGNLILADELAEKRFKNYLALKEGDRVRFRKNADGRFEMHKGNLKLGIFLNMNSADRHGFVYRDANGAYTSYINNLSGKSFDILSDNLEALKEFWKTNNIGVLVNSNIELRSLLESMVNHNRPDKYRTISQIPVETLRFIIAPVFHSINQHAYEQYTPAIARSIIEHNYKIQNDRLRVDNELSNELEAQLQESGKPFDLYISSLSTGQRVYNNGVIDTKTKSEAFAEGLRTEDNLLRRIPSHTGMFTVGVKDFTNRSNSVVDINTGEEINAENQKSIKEDGRFAKSMFFATEVINGKTYLHGVTQAIASNSKHIDGKGAEYGKKLVEMSIKNLIDFANDDMSVEEFKHFVQLFYGYNSPGSTNTLHASVHENDGRKVFQIKISDGNNNNPIPTYFALISEEVTVGNKVLKDITYGLGNKISSSGTVEFNKNRVTRGVAGTQIGTNTHVEYLKSTVFNNVRRGVMIDRTTSNNAVLSDSVYEEGGIFQDPITKKYYSSDNNGYMTFLLESGALATNLDGVKAKDGTPLSGFNPNGAPRAVIFAQRNEPTHKIINKNSRFQTMDDAITSNPVIDIDGNTNSTLDSLDGKVMDFNEFLKLIDISEGNDVSGVLVKAHFGFLLNLLDNIYSDPLKVKFVNDLHADDKVLDGIHEDKSNSIGSTKATYANGLITIYAPMIQMLDGNFRGNEDMTLTFVHEILHDVLGGVKEYLLTQEGGQEKMKAIEKDILDFVDDLETQLTENESIGTKEYKVGNATITGRRILANYIQAVKTAAQENKWQEAIIYPFSDLYVAQALNDIESPNSAQGVRTSFFEQLLDKILNLINKVFNINIDVNQDSRLEEISLITSDLGFAIDAISKSQQPIKRGVNPQAYAISTEFENHNPQDLYQAMLDNNLTIMQQQIFETVYNNDFNVLKRAANPTTLLSEWNDFPGRTVMNTKLYSVSNKVLADAYMQKFGEYAKVKYNQSTGRYDMQIKKPTDAKSIEIVSEHLMPQYGRKFNPIVETHLSQFYTRVLNDMYRPDLLATGVTSDNKHHVQQDAKIPSMSDYSNRKRSIKTDLITEIKRIIDETESSNKSILLEAIADLEQTNSETFAKFIMYYNKEHNADIIDVEAMSDTMIDGIPFDEFITKNWDDMSQMRINHIDKASSHVKMVLSSIIRKPSAVLGVNVAVNINEVWYELHANLHDKQINKQSIIDTLSKMGTKKEMYQNIASYIEASDDVDFVNGLMSLAKMTILEVHAISQQYLNQAKTLDMPLNNRGAWGSYTIFDAVKKNVRLLIDTDERVEIIEKYRELVESIHAIYPELATKSAQVLQGTRNTLSRKEAKLGLSERLQKSDNVAMLDDVITKNKLLLSDLFSMVGIEGYATLNDEELRFITYRLIGVVEPIIESYYHITDEVLDGKMNAGYLMQSATILSKLGHKATNFSYFNVNGDTEFALQPSFYLSDFYRGFNNANNDELLAILQERFEDISHDTRSKFSNWLWERKSGKGQPNAIFGYTDVAGNSMKKQKVANSVGLDFTRKHMGLTVIDGLKFIEDSMGIKSDNITHNVYDLLSLAIYMMGGRNLSEINSAKRNSTYFLINQSDSPRTHAIKGPLFDVIGDRDVFSEEFKLMSGSNTMNALSNIMLQDLAEMYEARRILFDVVDGELVLKDKYKGDNLELNLKDLHRVKHGEYNKKTGKFEIIRNGVPLGEVFTFNTLTYINENGETITFNDYLKEQEGYKNSPLAYLTAEKSTGEHFVVKEDGSRGIESIELEAFDTAKQMLQGHIEAFINIAIESRTNADLQRLSVIKDFFTNLHKRTNLDKRVSEPLMKAEDWDITVREFSINNFIAQVEIGNMFSGSLSEYNTGVEHNKRVSGYIKPGHIAANNSAVNTLLVRDMFKNTSKANMDNFKKMFPEHIADLFNNINIADGFSFITIEHYEDRLEQLGKKYLYKDLIDEIKETGRVAPAKYDRYLESIKFFYQDRQLKGRELKGDAIQETDSYRYLHTSQIKNSAIVLSDATFKTTQMNNLYHFMKGMGLHEIDFDSTQKVTKAVPLDLFTEDGGINPNISEDVIRARTEIKNLENFRLQQETKPHMVDEVIKLGVQISKMVFNDLGMDFNYTNHDGSKNTGAELFNDANKMMSANIIESTYKLLDSWGAVENGKIVRDEQNRVLVDINRITDDMVAYIEREGIDNNLLEAIKRRDDGQSALPFWAPIHYKKLSSVLLSKFTKEVVDQKLPGIHAPMVPNIFLDKHNVSNDGALKGADAVAKNRNGIQWLKSVHDGVADGSRTYELEYKTEYKDGKLIEYCEILLNPYYAEFIQGDFNIDINAIAKINPRILDMVGMRIPTEGKQSMVVAKVVGFLNNGATAVMFPKEMVPKTGSDFDIDSIYMYYRNADIKFNDKGVLESIDIHTYSEEANDPARFEQWAKEYKAKRFSKITEDLENSNATNDDEIYRDMRKAYNALKQDTHTNTKVSEELREREIETINSIIEYLPKRVKAKFEEKAATIGYTTFSDMLADLYITQKSEYIDPINELKREIKVQFSPAARNEITNLTNEATSITSLIDYTLNAMSLHRDLILSEQSTDDNLDDKGEVKKQLLDQMKQLRSKINNSLNEYYKTIYDELPIEQKNTRKARENKLIDIFETIIISENHKDEYHKPNDMLESEKAGDMINEMWGKATTNLNLFFYSDAATMRDMNMSVRRLKAISVGTDGLMSVLGITKAYFEEGMIFNLTSEQLGFTQLSTENAITRIEESVGKGNVTYANGVFNINFKHLSNNEQGNWRDILNLKITSQAAQTTSHILDAVSRQMGFNVNQHTIGVYKMLTYTGLNMMYEGMANKFVLPNLFIHQPIIVDYSNRLTAASIYGYVNRNSTPSILFEEYYTKIANHPNIESYIERFVKEEKIKDSLPEDIDIQTKIYKNHISKFKDGTKVNNQAAREGFLEFVEWASNLSKGDDFTVMSNSIKNYKTGNPSIETLGYQVSHFNRFLEYSRKADSITGLVSTLNQDKKKLGPTTADTRLNVDKVTKYNNNASEQVGQEGSSAILVDGRPILEMILPSHFGQEHDSRYGVFETYFDYGGKMAQDVLSNISVLDHPIIRGIKDKILETINSTHKQIEVDNLITSYTSNYLLEVPNILKYDMWDDSTGDLEQLNINMKRRINGMGKAYKDTVVKFRDIVEVGNNLQEEHYEAFKTLPLSEKIKLLKRSTRHKDVIYDALYEGSHIINILDTNTDAGYFEANKRTSVTIVNGNHNKDYAIFSLSSMLNSNDKFFSDVALDLIRYAYINNGLNFGNNISKFIGVDVITKHSETIQGDPNTPVNQLATIGQQLYAMRDAIEGINEDDLYRNFIRSNANNTAVVYSFRQADLKKANILNLTAQDVNGTKVAYAVDYKTDIDDYIGDGTEYFTIGNYGDKTLFKRYTTTVKGVEMSVSIAIQKQSIYETGYTIFEENMNSKLSVPLEHSTQVNYQVELDPSLVYDPIMLDGLIKEVEADEIFHNLLMTDWFNMKADNTLKGEKIQTKDDTSAKALDVSYVESNTQSEAFKEMSNKYDNIFYIGDNSGFEYKMFNNIKPVTHINMTNAKEMAREINKKNNSSRVAILGNVVSDAKTQNTISTLVHYLESYNPSLEHIGVISNSNVGNMVKTSSKTHIDSYTTEKNVPSTIAHSIDITYKTQEQQRSLDKQIDVLKIMNRNVKELAKKYDSSGAEFVKDLKRTKDTLAKDDIYKRMMVEDLEAVSESIHHQTKLLTKLVDYATSKITELQQVDYHKWGEYTDEQRQEKINIITELLDITSMATMSKELSMLHYDALTLEEADDVKHLKQINESLENLKQTTNRVDEVRNRVNMYAQNYISATIAWRSRRPGYKTKFADTDISPEDIRLNIEKFLKDNEDINIYQLWLDSAFSTGVAAIDNVLLEYAHLEGIKNRTEAKIKDDFADLIGSIWGNRFVLNPNEVAEGKPAKYDRVKITSDSAFNDELIAFTRTILDPKTGKMYSEYNWSEYKKDVSKILDERRVAIQAINDTDLSNKAKSIKIRLILKHTDNEISALSHTQGSEETLLSDKMFDKIDELRKILTPEEFIKYLRAKNLTFEHIPYDPKDKTRKAKKDNLDTDSTMNLAIYKIVPIAKYKNSAYANLDENQKKLMHRMQEITQNILRDVYNVYNVSDDFFPIMQPYESKNIFKEQIMGIQKIRHDEEGRGINGEIFKIYEPQFMDYTKYNPVYDLGYKRITETQEGYEKRVLESINKSHTKSKKSVTDNTPFTSLEAVREYNKLAEQNNIDRTVKTMMVDPYKVINNFAHVSLEHKKVMDFTARLDILESVMKGSDFEVWSKSKGKTQKIKGEDSKAYDRVKNFRKTVRNDSKVKTKIDVVLNLIKQQTSLTYMAFNVTGGIKNISTGFGNELMESAAGEFTNRQDLWWAMKNYPSMDLIRSIGSDYSDNMYTAIIKRFEGILDLKKEKGFDHNEDDKRTHIYMMAHNSMYFMNSMTEHYMQFTMLLAMMKSSKIVNGNIVHFTEYAKETRLNTLSDILSTTQMDSLRQFIKDSSEKNKNSADNPDYIRTWLYTNSDSETAVTKSQLQEYSKVIKKVEKDIRTEFDKHEDVFSQMELVDGRAVLKKDALINDTDLDYFQKKVHTLNQTLHGIYNRIDRNRLKDTLLGDLALQFRSWMRPNWGRYYGLKWGRSLYNESLGSYRKGAYTSLGQFIFTPISTNITKYKMSDATVMETLRNIAKDTLPFLLGLRTHWHTMSLQDRQNAKRAIQNLVNIAFFGGVLALLSSLTDEDDDDDRSYLLALALYQTNANLSEASEFLPIIGWINSINRTKDSPMASEKVLMEWFGILNNILLYIPRSESARTHKRGVYKDRDRLGVSLMKNTPVLRQFHKMSYIPTYTSWYKLYNPAAPYVDFIEGLNKDDKSKK